MYEALEDGRIKFEPVRAIWVSVVLAELAEHDPIWIAVDGSNIARPSVLTSADRTIIHLPNLPLIDKPISVGWAFSTVVVVPEQASSWTPFWSSSASAVSRPRSESLDAAQRAFLGLGTTVEVLLPSELRNQLQKEASSVASLYSFRLADINLQTYCTLPL